MQAPTPKKVGNYILGKTIGRGGSATVKLARHMYLNIEAAAKIVDKTKLKEDELSRLIREVNVLRELNHSGIIQLFEVIDTTNYLFLFLEYASNGELFDYLVAHGRISEREARIKFFDICSAVFFCHKKRIVHRDLKAENLLLDQNFNIKVADFGLGRVFNESSKLSTFCGSPAYASPELFNGTPYIGPEVDVWALGVILYIMLTGCMPFRDTSATLQGDYVCPRYLSQDAIDVIDAMLTINPADRPDLGKVLQMEWFASLDERVQDANRFFLASSFSEMDLNNTMRGHSEFNLASINKETIEIMLAHIPHLSEFKIKQELLDNNFNEVTSAYNLIKYLQKCNPAEYRNLLLNATDILSKRAALQDADEYLEKEDTCAQNHIEGSAASPIKKTSAALTSESRTGMMMKKPSISNLAASAAKTGGKSSASRASPAYVPASHASGHASSPTHTVATQTVSLPASPQTLNEPTSPTSPTPPQESHTKKPRGLSGFIANTRIRSSSVGKTPSQKAVPFETSSHTSPKQHHAPSPSATATSAASENVPEHQQQPHQQQNATLQSPATPASSKSSLPHGRARGMTVAVTTNRADPKRSKESLIPLQDTYIPSGNSSPAPISSPTSISTNASITSTTLSGASSSQVAKPRVNRFGFALSTTSSKNPLEMMHIIENVLSNFLDNLSPSSNIEQEPIYFSHINCFLLSCTCSNLEWEMEVCKLPLLNLHGVKFKRVSGSTTEYKNICGEILKQLKQLKD